MYLRKKITPILISILCLFSMNTWAASQLAEINVMNNTDQDIYLFNYQTNSGGTFLTAPTLVSAHGSSGRILMSLNSTGKEMTFEMKPSHVVCLYPKSLQGTCNEVGFAYYPGKNAYSDFWNNMIAEAWVDPSGPHLKVNYIIYSITNNKKHNHLTFE